MGDRPNMISDDVSNRVGSGYFTPKLEPEVKDDEEQDQNHQIDAMNEIEGKMDELAVGDGKSHFTHLERSVELETDSDKELEPNPNQLASAVSEVIEKPPMNRKLPSYLD